MPVAEGVPELLRGALPEAVLEPEMLPLELAEAHTETEPSREPLLLELALPGGDREKLVLTEPQAEADPEAEVL